MDMSKSSAKGLFCRNFVSFAVSYFRSSEWMLSEWMAYKLEKCNAWVAENLAMDCKVWKSSDVNHPQ